MSNKQPSKQITVRKVAANRENALKSTGPRDTRLTSRNAQKHALLSCGVTEMDDPGSFWQLHARFKNELAPEGETEIALVEHITLCAARLRRAAVLEAEYITAKLHPVVTNTIYPEGDTFAAGLESSFGKVVVIDPGIPSRLSVEEVEKLLTFQRYETAIKNKFYRALNQLERLQRRRRGDNIPAPAALDVTVHHGSDDVASFGNAVDEEEDVARAGVFDKAIGEGAGGEGRSMSNR